MDLLENEEYRGDCFKLIDKMLKISVSGERKWVLFQKIRIKLFKNRKKMDLLENGDNEERLLLFERESGNGIYEKKKKMRVFCSLRKWRVFLNRENGFEPVR